ncbi:MAG TPA: hypothetical protein VGN26_17960 [Armatimonadota bacterium]|jgi:hypothetical protein
MDSTVREAGRRARRHAYEDGLAELVTGALFVAVGAYILAQSLVKPGSVWWVLLGVGLPVLLLAGNWAAARATRALKSNISYPRTGYVACAPSPGQCRAARWLAVGVVVTLAILVLYSALVSPVLLGWMALGQGVIVGAILLMIGWQAGVVRMSLLASVSLVLGGLISYQKWDATLGSGVFYLAFGSVLLLTGAVMMARFLRANRPVSLDSDDE